MSRTLSIAPWEYTTTDGEFTVAELHKAFDIVADPNDWRGPIDAIVPAAEVAISVQAIGFYTGAGVRTNRADAPAGCEGGEFWRLQSVGYREGPAGS